LTGTEGNHGEDVKEYYFYLDNTPTHSYEDVASKFWEHYVYIANSMNSLHDRSKSLWDEEDGFFYDYLLSREHKPIPVRTRTMVGFVPMFGASVVPATLSCR